MNNISHDQSPILLKRTLSGEPPRIQLPSGTVDTQMHMYLPGYPAIPGGPGLPPAPLPTPDMYRQVMQWLGIDRVVITQGNAHQADNACLLKCLQEMGEVASGVAVITPETTDKEIIALCEAGIVGARIMDLPGGAIGFDALEWIDARCAELGWMIAIQFDGSHLKELEPSLSTLRSRWVLDHHGKIFSGATPAHVATLKRLLDRGNMWFKFAGCYESSRSGGPDYADIAAVARDIGLYAPERVVWGTNWPHNLAKTIEEYPNDAELVDTVLGWLSDDCARLAALVHNPQSLYKL